MKLIQIFCQHNHLISKCLNCKVASSSLRFPRTYKQCQLQLLQYLSSKESFIPKQKNEFSALKKLIKSKSLIIGFVRLCCLFLVANEKKITKVKEAHCKDLKDLGMVSLAGSHNPDKLIVNQLPYRLPGIEKTILAKSLNFAVPPKKLNYADYLVRYELLFRDKGTFVQR